MLPFDPTTRALQHNSVMYYSNITESCYRQRELQTRTLRHALNIIYSFICVYNLSFSVMVSMPHCEIVLYIDRKIWTVLYISFTL